MEEHRQMGVWYVLRPAGKKGRVAGKRKWNCRCSVCGLETTVVWTSLTRAELNRSRTCRHVKMTDEAKKARSKQVSEVFTQKHQKQAIIQSEFNKLLSIRW